MRGGMPEDGPLIARVSPIGRKIFDRAGIGNPDYGKEMASCGEIKK